MPPTNVIPSSKNKGSNFIEKQKGNSNNSMLANAKTEDKILWVSKPPKKIEDDEDLIIQNQFKIIQNSWNHKPSRISLPVNILTIASGILIEYTVTLVNEDVSTTEVAKRIEKGEYSLILPSILLRITKFKF